MDDQKQPEGKTRKCKCGEEFLEPVTFSVDLSPYVGVPIDARDLPGYQCSRCHAVGTESHRFNVVLDHVAFGFLKKPSGIAAKCLTFIRERVGWSREKLGESMGETPITVAQWENEEREMSAPQERKFRALMMDAIVERFEAYPDVMKVLEVIEECEAIRESDKRTKNQSN